MSRHRVQCIRRRESIEIALVEARTVGEIGDTGERRLAARLDDAPCTCCGQAGDESHAEAHRRIVAVARALERAIPAADGDVDRAYLDAVPACVADELRGGV